MALSPASAERGRAAIGPDISVRLVNPNRVHHYPELSAEEGFRVCLSGTPDIALCNDESCPHDAVQISELVSAGVPVLHIADGMLEWRNTWENPRDASEGQRMPLFQPVLAHKIACVGPSQCRLLEHWGNVGKCESTGLPRLDSLFDARERFHGRESQMGSAGKPSGVLTVLVMTARTPGFNQKQLDTIMVSLQCLQVSNQFLCIKKELKYFNSFFVITENSRWF